MGCVMSTIDIAYLAIVLSAFIGFAAVLAYYSQTCAKPTTSKQSEPANRSPRLAGAH
jgi:hypothetical protein